MHVWALPTPTQQDRRWIKRIFFTEPRVEEAASFAVRSPNALQHKKEGTGSSLP